MPVTTKPVIPTQVEFLGLSPYESCWQAMKDYTDNRVAESPDRLWITEHLPVYTQGLNGKPEHLLNPDDIPVVQIDRGGQVTYHGPGQLVLYCLLDLPRLNICVKGLVSRIEQSIIEWLAGFGIAANTRKGAPGVYVDDAKIAALGLRIRRKCSYHGLSLNLDMDLEPFSRINPCGYQGLPVTQMADFGISTSLEQAGRELSDILIRRLHSNQDNGR